MEEIINIEITGKLTIPIYSDDEEFIEEMKNLGADLKNKNNLEIKEEHIKLIWEHFNDAIYENLEDMLDEKNTTFKFT